MLHHGYMNTPTVGPSSPSSPSRIRSKSGGVFRSSSFQQSDKMNLVSLLESVPEQKPQIPKNTNKDNNPSKKKKTVRFYGNDDGKIKRKVYKYTQKQAVDPNTLWWSENELTEIRKGCTGVMKWFTRHEDYTWALAVLYNSLNTEVVSKEDVEGARRVVVRCWEARGLEKRIYRTARVRMTEHVTSTLKAATAGPAALRKQSRLTSQQSAKFALTTANLDARQAASEYLTY